MGGKDLIMEKLEKNIKLILTFGGWIISFIIFLWTTFGIYYRTTEDLKIIQKSTLRNTIWNNNIPMHDRLESCDSYLALGYNSETKKYCNDLLESEVK